jgi:hypothetical protein
MISCKDLVSGTVMIRLVISMIRRIDCDELAGQDGG